ncbi:linoleoyl-CoA desaturase activity [Seminavis robusta]|uniref:Linoleoyl-CoA desaturase activity n=1 Tax=Seminavis robusta TaxID=568900 RepID=A0A9N8DTV4_9STRA|nr:linoleoyl-CoA desaturase activity [Seminavis robusta]|eukprot:Sro347_g123060.1 linoleoyl-CoA desaturase activity (423) ;mRNA; f:64633-66000
MAPNLKPIYLSNDTELLTANDVDQAKLTELLDKHADTDGLKNINGDNEDWTDVKHSERKKRDRILDDGVLIKLMKKSDYKGFERLFINLSIGALTIYAIRQLDIKSLLADPQKILDQPELILKLVAFCILYPFYGFQFQAFAFAGQHEFLHRNAFKTKWINDLVLFLTGVFTFELGAHERVMHKQHHTYTNNIDKDPELTSYYTREQLELPGFRNVPFTRFGYLMQFLDVFYTFKCRLGRVFFSILGVAVDYSGTGWSLKEWTYSKESGIMKQIQNWAICQVLCQAAIVANFGQTMEGLQNLAFWWLCPVLIGYPVVNYCRNLEHADCEVSDIPNCLLNTRTVRSNILIRTLLWDTNFHAEHHCYPMVPFFNLHKVNALMHDHVVHNETGNFTVQNWACFKPGGWIDKQRKINEAGARAKAE